MEDKGQASVEYLLIVVVILIILATITVPLVSNSVTSTMDVSKASDTNNAIQSVANAVNLVYANGHGAKRTISLYIPSTMDLIGNNSKVIGMIVPTSGNATFISASTNYNVTFNNATFTKGWHQVTVTFPVGSKSIILTHQLQ